MGSQTEKMISYVIGTMSAIGFIMQALSEQNYYIRYIGIAIVALMMVAALIHGAKTRTVVKRKTVIRRGNQIIQSAQNRVVLFGGDLSWTKDYISLPKQISDDGIVIEVIFPLERYDDLSVEVKKKFDQRLNNLSEAGAFVYSVQTDIGLRCMLVDPDTGHLPENMKLLITNRISRCPEKPHKNKYHALLLSYSDIRQKQLCMAYLSHYRLLQQSRTPVDAEKEVMR